MWYKTFGVSINDMNMFLKCLNGSSNTRTRWEIFVTWNVRRLIPIKTRLNMLFIPTLPLKAALIAMLRILCNAGNTEQCWAMCLHGYALWLQYWHILILYNPQIRAGQGRAKMDWTCFWLDGLQHIIKQNIEVYASKKLRSLKNGWVDSWVLCK